MTNVVELATFDRIFPDSQDVVREWRGWLAAIHRPRTVRGYTAHIRRLLDACGKPVHDITESDLLGFMGRYKPNSASRQGIYYASRSLWRFGVRRGMLMADITESVPAPRVRDKTPDALGQDELLSVALAAEKRDYIRGLVVWFLYLTGARVNEACCVRWLDIHDDNIHFRTTKGGDERVVPVTEKLGFVLAGLEAYQEDDRVIPRVPGTIEAWCAQAGKEAGINRRVYPHLFRSTALTTMLDRGVPVQVASRYAGHKNIKTTHRYLATKDPDLRKAGDAL